jgi:hypothetical protein
MWRHELGADGRGIFGVATGMPLGAVALRCLHLARRCVQRNKSRGCTRVCGCASCAARAARNATVSLFMPRVTFRDHGLRLIVDII